MALRKQWARIAELPACINANEAINTHVTMEVGDKTHARGVGQRKHVLYTHIIREILLHVRRFSSDLCTILVLHPPRASYCFESFNLFHPAQIQAQPKPVSKYSLNIFTSCACHAALTCLVGEIFLEQL